MSLLSVSNLSVQFFSPGKPTITAVDRVSFSMESGEILGLAGESGSGKTTLAYSLIGLLPRLPFCRVSGTVFFKGRDLFTLSKKERAPLFGNEISMVFQEPLSALNPVIRVGNQACEIFKIHRPEIRPSERRQRVVELFERLGIEDAEKKFCSFPHELSGGQRQRVLLTMAVALKPKLLIADEPTTALDPSTRSHALELIRDLQKKENMSMLWISHDLHLLRNLAQRVGIMYAGGIVEMSPTEAIFKKPEHPYTNRLVSFIDDY